MLVPPDLRRRRHDRPANLSDLGVNKCKGLICPFGAELGERRSLRSCEADRPIREIE